MNNNNSENNTAITNNENGQQTVIIIENSPNAKVNISSKLQYENACNFIKKELIDDLDIIYLQFKIIENNEPKVFWDLRKPNETNFAFQERITNYHINQKNSLIQNIHKLPIKRNIYDSNITHLVNAEDKDEKAQKLFDCYKHIDSFIYHINTYIERYDTNISLYKEDDKIVYYNALLYREKLVDLKTTTLDIVNKLIQTFDDIKSEVKVKLDDFGYSNTFFQSNFNCGSIFNEMSRLYKEKSNILAESLKKKQRTVINTHIKDPYLKMLRKGCNLDLNLSDAEKWNIEYKKYDESISTSIKLVQAAAFSYLELDGLAASYYFKKALNNNDYSQGIRTFIEKSLKRLEEPDIFEGSIGLIILDISKKSCLSGKGVKSGDIIFKVNGDIVNEPLDVSSEIAKTPKDQNVLLDFYTHNNQFRKIAIYGSKSLDCKISQLIILNVLQI